MFVVVSIGSGFLTRERTAGIRAFLTSTVIHLSTALFGALLTMVPRLDGLWFGVVVLLAGIAGLGYSLHAALGFRQHEHAVLSDLFWYMILPLVGYALVVAAAGSAFMSMRDTVELFAGGLALMLLAGIRNAWDMIVFLVTMDRNTG